MRGYFWAEDEVFDQPVSIYAKLTYLYLKRRADAGGMSWPSIRSIASAVSSSTRQVQRALAELVQAGMLHADSGKAEGRPNTYVVNSVRPRDAEPDDESRREARPPGARPRPPVMGRYDRQADKGILTTRNTQEGIPLLSPDDKIAGEPGGQAPPPGASTTTATATPATKKVETDDEWRLGLLTEPAFAGVAVELELAKAHRWAKREGRKATRRFLENWLMRADRTVKEKPNGAIGGAIARAWEGQTYGKVDL